MHAYHTQYRPRIAQALVAPAPVVSTSPATSGAPVPEGLFWTAVAGTAAYAGILTATREKGWKSGGRMGRRRRRGPRGRRGPGRRPRAELWPFPGPLVLGLSRSAA